MIESDAEVLRVLEATSRTFFIPLSRLPQGLKETMMAAYLSMRAIDEIEDHPTLSNDAKVYLLREISVLLQGQTSTAGFNARPFIKLLEEYPTLPEVTHKIASWLQYVPLKMAPFVWNHVASMADRMAYWVEKEWHIRTKEDLDSYTFSVAGVIGLLICEAWMHFYNEALSSIHAIHFGRALQLVNIVRNWQDDAQRGVSFFPLDWQFEQMWEYADHNLQVAQDYAQTLHAEPFTYLIKIPLALARATLDAIAQGATKLSRDTVNNIVDRPD